MKKIKKWLVAFTMLLTLAIGIGTLTSCDKITTWIDSNSTERTRMSMSIPSANAQGIEPLADTINLGTFASDEYAFSVRPGDYWDFDARRVYLAHDQLIDNIPSAIKLSNVDFFVDIEYYESDMGSDYAMGLSSVDTAFYFLEDYNWGNPGQYTEYFLVSEYVLSIDEVIDKNAPTIGGSVNVSIDIDNQPSQEEILSHVSAWDDTDGVVPVVVESSSYVQGEMVIGVSYINVSATDKAGNKGTGVITCHKNDYTAPVIAGQSTYDLNYDHDLNLDKIKENLNITDNVDENLELELVSDNFTSNSHKLGNYQVVFKTKDLSNNVSANFTINLSVKNKGTAVITAVNKITIPTSQLFTLAELKAKISVVDGYDGVIEDYVIAGFDDYTATSKEVGTNVITISYTNSGGNTATAYIELVKEDNIPPVILYDSYFILLKQGEVFTRDMAKQHASKVLAVSTEDIVSIEGYYDTNTLGNYDLEVCLVSNEVRTFRLSVVEEYSYENKSSIESNYWEVLWNETRVNLWNYNGWTWLNWTMIGVGAAGLVTIIVLVVKFRKKNDSEDYNSTYRY